MEEVKEVKEEEEETSMAKKLLCCCSKGRYLSMTRLSFIEFKSRILKDKGDSGGGGREERGEEQGQARAEPGSQVALLLQRYFDKKEQNIKIIFIIYFRVRKDRGGGDNSGGDWRLQGCGKCRGGKLGRIENIVK